MRRIRPSSSAGVAGIMEERAGVGIAGFSEVLKRAIRNFQEQSHATQNVPSNLCETFDDGPVFIQSHVNGRI